MLKSAIDLIGQGLNNYRYNWRKFLPYLILLIIPGVAVFLAGYIGIEIELHLRANRLINDIIIFLIYVASLIFSFWVTVSLTRTTALTTKNEQIPSWKEILLNDSRLIMPIILNSILVTLLIAVGSILFIIPGIIFFVWYNFSTYTMILDNQTWTGALKASKNLVIGRWWSIAWKIFAIVVFYAIVSMVLQFIINSGVGLIKTSETTMEVIQNSISSLINILITPALVSSLIGLYLDAKANPVISKPQEIA